MTKNKRGRRAKKKGGQRSKGKAPRPQTTPRQSPPQVQSQAAPPRMGWRVAKWALWTAPVAVLAIASGFASLWGPPWPTAPEFSPGPPSRGQPFDVPFVVKNRSALFPIRGLSLDCHLIRASTASGTEFVEDLVSTGFDALLAPGQQRPYTCPFGLIGDGTSRITRAQMEFVAQYRSWRPLQKRLAVFKSDVFTLDTRTIPPQWERGIPLR